MFKSLQFKKCLLLLALIVGSTSVWADEITYTFTGKNWTATAGGSDANWTSGKDGGNYSNDGIQVTTTYTGANATSPISFTDVTRIVCTYNTNKSGGKGSIEAQIGTNDATTNEVAYSGSGDGRSAYYTTTFTYATPQTGNVKLTVNTETNSIYLCSVTITYGAPTSVTGVSLDESALSLEIGETFTLTETVAPGDASNKSVTWSTSDGDVATVDGGVVTAVGVGTATITVTTADGGFTATCAVTVKEPAAPSVILDFTNNDWGISEAPTKTVDAKNFTSGGYTITLEGSTGNGYYFDTDNIMLGKSGATLTLPAFDFNVSKIKVYGKESGASGSVKFNVFVGDDEVSTVATSSQVTHEFEIAAAKQAAGTIYVIKVTNAANMRISKIEIFGYENATVTDAGWASFVPTNAVQFEEGDAFVVESASSWAVLSPVTKVPAGTPVLLKGEGTKTAVVLDKAPSAPTSNLLRVGDGSTPTNPYVLSKPAGEEVGFYKWSGTAANLTGKVYLEAPAAARDFLGFNDETTGISAVEKAANAGMFFDMQGRRVAQPTKGLYIVNGKKVLVK